MFVVTHTGLTPFKLPVVLLSGSHEFTQLPLTWALPTMARPFDICVFGATGFTGKFIADTAFALPGLRLCLAGRSGPRLQALANELSSKHNKPAPAILPNTDVSNPASLLAMAQQCRVLIDAVGPFRFFGEPVVKAAIAGKCHYLDISGEPEYMERIELLYHEAAAAAGVLLLSACGFDSLVADLGVIFAQETMRAMGKTCTAVESYLSLQGGKDGVAGHYATFESAVHGFASAGELRKLRKDYAAKHPETARLPVYAGGGMQKLKRHDGPFWAKAVKQWAIPFMGSDAAVVKRTQRESYRQMLQSKGAAAATSSGGSSAAAAQSLPVQYAAYAIVPSFVSGAINPSISQCI